MTGVVLDTNLVSEPRRPRPEAGVLAWFAARNPEDLFVTATVIGELTLGASLLPRGRFRAETEAWLRTVVRETFAGRVLAYDAEAAALYGEIVAIARARGRQPGINDAQIAAVALRDGLTVATRNVRDFTPLGVRVVNPWDAAEPA